VVHRPHVDSWNRQEIAGPNGDGWGQLPDWPDPWRDLVSQRLHDIRLLVRRCQACGEGPIQLALHQQSLCLGWCCGTRHSKQQNEFDPSHAEGDQCSVKPGHLPFASRWPQVAHQSLYAQSRHPHHRRHAPALTQPRAFRRQLKDGRQRRQQDLHWREWEQAEDQQPAQSLGRLHGLLPAGSWGQDPNCALGTNASNEAHPEVSSVVFPTVAAGTARFLYLGQRHSRQIYYWHLSSVSFG
jgi:hypothetical protein